MRYADPAKQLLVPPKELSGLATVATAHRSDARRGDLGELLEQGRPVGSGKSFAHGTDRGGRGAGNAAVGDDPDPARVLDVSDLPTTLARAHRPEQIAVSAVQRDVAARHARRRVARAPDALRGAFDLERASGETRPVNPTGPRGHGRTEGGNERRGGAQARRPRYSGHRSDIDGGSILPRKVEGGLEVRVRSGRVGVGVERGPCPRSDEHLGREVDREHQLRAPVDHRMLPEQDALSRRARRDRQTSSGDCFQVGHFGSPAD